MGVEISGVKAHVAVHFGLQGSVLAGTIQASAPKVETRYEIESPLGGNAGGAGAGGGGAAECPQWVLGAGGGG